MKAVTVATMIALYSGGVLAKVDLENSFLLSSGMDKKEVLETMGGKPIASEFLGDLEEWHYCKVDAWRGRLSYTTVFFYQGKVIGMKQYGTSDSVGTCQSRIKTGSYQEPDVVKEYRIKMQ